MAKKRGEFPVEESSGNVFADLGLSDPEERLAKADLAIAISREIQGRGLRPKPRPLTSSVWRSRTSPT